MDNIPIINPPDKETLGFCWNHQFTIPLLFDDCLSLLQKVCALWAKLNDVIDSLNDFNAEFNAWAKSVEDSLKDLYAKYSALESRVSKNEQDIASIKQKLASIENELNTIKNDIGNIKQRLNNIDSRLSNIETEIASIQNSISNIESEIASIKNSISNINNSIAQIRSDISALESRVKHLEDLLKNLNIIPPQTVLDLTENESEWRNVWNSWWNWFCTNVITFASGDSKSNWEYSANLKWHDTTTQPTRKIQIGYLGQPVCSFKLPFIAVRKSVWTSKPTFNQIMQAAPTFNTNTLYPANGFFDLALTKEFGFVMDEVKLMTSYIPFLTKQSQLVKVVNSSVGQYSFSIQADVRMQVPEHGLSAKLSIVPQMITVAAVPNSEQPESATAWDLYLYCIAENG